MPNTESDQLGLIVEAYAHCDAPCGVYDPASARVAGEAVQSMTKKMLHLECPDTSDAAAMAGYLNTMSRYAAVKEEEAQKCKRNCLFFGPTSSNQTILNRSQICMKPFGMPQNCAVHVKLRFLRPMHKNLWMLLRQYTTCSGKPREEKFLGSEQAEALTWLRS